MAVGNTYGFFTAVHNELSFTAVGNAHDVRFAPVMAAASMTHMFFMAVATHMTFTVVGSTYGVRVTHDVFSVFLSFFE